MREEKKTVFETPWFNIERVSFPDILLLKKEEYYRINSPDGIIVLATTKAREIIVVRQFRPLLANTLLSSRPARLIQEKRQNRPLSVSSLRRPASDARVSSSSVLVT